MGRGPESKETKLRKALELAKEALGVTVEVEPQLETTIDKIMEAQAVLNYFKVGGKGFKYKMCSNCDEVFAYSWEVDGVSCCSITCMAASLEKIGIKWDSTRPLNLRWGRTAPALISAEALSILTGLTDTPKDLAFDTPL